MFVSASELPGLRFYWDADKGFDILDPVIDVPIDEAVVEREARLAEVRARLLAEARANESEARLLRG